MAVIAAFCRPLSTCPICSRKTNEANRPFCSRRCADVDLAKWFGGNYVIHKSDFWGDLDSNDANEGMD